MDWSLARLILRVVATACLISALSIFACLLFALLEFGTLRSWEGVIWHCMARHDGRLHGNECDDAIMMLHAVLLRQKHRGRGNEGDIRGHL